MNEPGAAAPRPGEAAAEGKGYPTVGVLPTVRRVRLSPAQCVPLLQALTARELVEIVGLPGHRAAAVLGIAPSAVSQYVTGKRRGGPLAALSNRPEVQALVRDLARTLARESRSATPNARPLLDAASALYEIVVGGDAMVEPAPARSQARRELARQLRQRIAAEQTAVSDCMQLAQRSRDELTRALFRHIASDSLRHAEIAASLASYLDRGIDRTWASGINHADVERLIAREKAAEQDSEGRLDRSLGGVMSLLAMSMAADEHKHAELLKRLLKVGFLEDAPSAAPTRRGASGTLR
jgi:hypothetical protein